jgi:hypothetical protein
MIDKMMLAQSEDKSLLEDLRKQLLPVEKPCYTYVDVFCIDLAFDVVVGIDIEDSDPPCIYEVWLRGVDIADVLDGAVFTQLQKSVSATLDKLIANKVLV